MQRDRQGVGVGIEDPLRAVAVMHVPVDRRDTAQLVRGAGMADRDGHIGEEAEAHASVGRCVVAGWPHQRIGILHVAPHHGIQRRHGTAGSQLRDFEAAPAEGCQNAGIAAVLGAHGLDAGDMLARVLRGQAPPPSHSAA